MLGARAPLSSGALHISSGWTSGFELLPLWECFLEGSLASPSPWLTVPIGWAAATLDGFWLQGVGGDSRFRLTTNPWLVASSVFEQACPARANLVVLAIGTGASESCW